MPAGRPKKELNVDSLRKLRKMQCTDVEIAAFFDVSVDTIARRRESDPDFAEVYKNGGESGKISLRRMQWQSARKGNVAMQIWLGKQYLGQTDKMLTPEETAEDIARRVQEFLGQANANTRVVTVS